MTNIVLCETYIAVEMMAMINRGIFANLVDIVMKLVHTVYSVGAHALGVLSASKTRRNLPNPPAGARMAPARPPTLLPLPSPSSHVVTYGAAAVKAAPMI